MIKNNNSFTFIFNPEQRHEIRNNINATTTKYCYGAHTLSISRMKSVISCKASIFFSHARLKGSIFSPYCDSIWHKLSQFGKKILYTYVYHIVYYPRNLKPCMRSLISCMRCSVYVHHKWLIAILFLNIYYWLIIFQYLWYKFWLKKGTSLYLRNVEIRPIFFSIKLGKNTIVR